MVSAIRGSTNIKYLRLVKPGTKDETRIRESKIAERYSRKSGKSSNGIENGFSDIETFFRTL